MFDTDPTTSIWTLHPQPVVLLTLWALGAAMWVFAFTSFANKHAAGVRLGHAATFTL